MRAQQIGHLAHRCRVSLRRARRQLPDFGQRITIRHLLHHTSGLRDQWEALSIAGWRLDDVITKEHILKMVRNQRELNFPPGSEYLYSNTGYALAAIIVQRVSGKSLAQFSKERLFTPLGMTHTEWRDDYQKVVPGRATASPGPSGATAPSPPRRAARAAAPIRNPPPCRRNAT